MRETRPYSILNRRACAFGTEIRAYFAAVRGKHPLRTGIRNNLD
jgi:hypothetical protein